MCYTLDYDLDFRFHMRVRQYTHSSRILQALWSSRFSRIYVCPFCVS